MDAWYSVRLFHADGTTLLLHDLLLSEGFGGGHLSYGLLGREGEICALPRDSHIVLTAWRETSGGQRIPTDLRVAFQQDGYQVSGTLHEARFLETIDVFGRLSWPVRTLIETFYTQVWIHRLLASYELNITDPRGHVRHIGGLAFVEIDTY